VLCYDSPFDVGILDFHMPEMDGITLAEKIRELPQCQDLPLIPHSADIRSDLISKEFRILKTSNDCRAII
jgi:CheY-like chemotaxis protein